MLLRSLFCLPACLCVFPLYQLLNARNDFNETDPTCSFAFGHLNEPILNLDFTII